jgi:hypothetical protein
MQLNSNFASTKGKKPTCKKWFRPTQESGNHAGIINNNKQ